MASAIPQHLDNILARNMASVDDLIGGDMVREGDLCVTNCCGNFEHRRVSALEQRAQR
jgi:hypothetical protein